MTECPAVFAGDDALDLIQAAQFLRKGILPEPGALSDQPYRLMKLIEYTNILQRNEDVAIMGHLAPLLQLGL